MFVQVGELRGTVVIAILKHLGAKAVGSFGKGNATCIIYTLKFIWGFLLFGLGGNKFLLCTSSCPPAHRDLPAFSSQILG